MASEYGTRINKFLYQKFLPIFYLPLSGLFTEISSNTDCINPGIHQTPPSALEKWPGGQNMLGIEHSLTNIFILICSRLESDSCSLPINEQRSHSHKNSSLLRSLNLATFRSLMVLKFKASKSRWFISWKNKHKFQTVTWSH